MPDVSLAQLRSLLTTPTLNSFAIAKEVSRGGTTASERRTIDCLEKSLRSDIASIEDARSKVSPDSRFLLTPAQLAARLLAERDRLVSLRAKLVEVKFRLSHGGRSEGEIRADIDPDAFWSGASFKDAGPRTYRDSRGFSYQLDPNGQKNYYYPGYDNRDL